MKSKKEVILKVLKFIGIVLLLYFGWILVHELIHLTICNLEGYNGKIYFTSFLLGSRADCPEISDNPEKFFLYGIGPYIFDVIIMVSFILKRQKNLLLRLTPHMAFFDIFWNFLMHLSGSKENDFTVLLSNAELFYTLALLIVILSVLIWIFGYFRKDLLEFIKMYF